MAKTVLVVDDSSSVRRMLGFALRTLGCRTLEAWCGAEAVKTVEQQPIDLVILDSELPDFAGLDGVPLVLARFQGRNLPVILLGNDPKPGLASGAPGQEDCFYIRKPFKMKDFADLVQAALG